jgi:hypothetical protein
VNAYELADELDKINDIPIETIINMLRQQADRIAELEKKCEDIYENGANVIDKCDKKIEELIFEINELQTRYDKLWDEAKKASEK